MKLLEELRSMRTLKLTLSVLVLFLLGFTLISGERAFELASWNAKAQAGGGREEARPIGSLKRVAIPAPSPQELAKYVADKNKAIALGKALFWDMQLGSDGMTACASCHYHAGADSRSRNQLNPGMRGGDDTFQLGGPNYQLTAADYPFHKLADPEDRNSVVSDVNDVTSSQGVYNTTFNDVVSGSPFDSQALAFDSVFNVSGLLVRRVAPRNAPSAINAVLFYRNFWDGRAQNDFNGVNPFGSRDSGAKVLRSVAGQLEPVTISLQDSSLASQAVGPPLSDFEMSAAGRTFQKLGKKMCSLAPLALQQIAPDDSALATLRNANGTGLNTTYAAMIRAAFQPEWWNSTQIVTYDSNGDPSFSPNPGRPLTTSEYTQMEANFSLFFGLAVQLYEATQVSDDSPFDRFMEGDATALTEQQKLGLTVFQTVGKCVLCHSGPEFSNASVDNVSSEPIERMIMGDNLPSWYDNGFYNIGVRPTSEDIGVGGTDPFGAPLSMSRIAKLRGQFPATDRVAADGMFKTPSLRNVELTAPYFHNGGQATLRQVIDFYDRGGDFSSHNPGDRDADIHDLGLTEMQQEALVAFLLSLTDERVRFHRAPFDHPSLQIPDGNSGDHNEIYNDGTGRGTEFTRLLGPVGRNGYSAPLPNFLDPFPCPSLDGLPNGVVGVQYIDAAGATPAGAYSFVLSSGSLPPGLFLNSANGAVTGIPTRAGAYTFTITANGAPCIGRRAYTIVICGTVSLTPTSLTGGVRGLYFEQSVTASPAGSYAYSLSSGALPPGLALNGATGKIFGTPTSTGFYSFRITARTEAGCGGSRNYTMNIAATCPAISLSPASLVGGKKNVAYRQTITASPTGSYSYSLIGGALPTGLSLNGATGQISGVPAAAGTFTFTVRGTRPDSCGANKSFTITISN